MRRCESLVAVLCSLLMLAPSVGAQTPQIQEPGGLPGTRKYRPPAVPPIDLSNSSRIEALLRAGNLYLSLQDAIALAVENNLDVAISRYGPLEAQTDLQRAQAGGALRGVSQAVTQGPSSAAGLSLNAFSSGSANVATTATAGVNGIVSQLGTAIPNYDPVLTGVISWGHTSSPQSTQFLYGTTSLVTTTKQANFTLQQGFATGAVASLGFNNQNSFLSSGRPDLNPLQTGNATLSLTQPLLSGFGFAVNHRGIHQAQNSLKVQDYVFKQQVMTTVAGIISLYWDLVSFNEQVKVTQQALETAQKLYEDNKKQVEIGTLAQIAIIQAEAEVATRQQDLTVAQTNVLQQETIIKNALSRNGVASPSVADAHIVPLDKIRVPDVEPIEPIQDLVAKAFADRPELPESRLNIENSKLSIVGDRSALLPSISAFTTLTNNGQAGPVNNLAPLSGNFRAPDPFFVGGYGNFLGQIFGRNFPDYRVGVQLNIPIRNRAAEADFVRDSLGLRQSELQLQKQTNQIRVDVQNSVVSLQQARVRYQAAVKSRMLEEQTLDAEQKKYALGASTIYNVIQIQRDLATAQGNEVVAESNYIKARNSLDFVTGQILQVNKIDVDEAYKGQVSRPPTPIPVLDQNGQNTKPERTKIAPNQQR
ncbi:MAG TPA: TolC family protein [Bryobacteraceae bacterium]|nr:TolC family protein [Bryobacteraceae bacterium]